MKNVDEKTTAEFERLRALLPGQAGEILSFSERPHTVVVIPSLSLDTEQLAKIKGISHYEERMLYLILLLRQPHAKVVLVTSQQVDFHAIEYLLGLLPEEERTGARSRLTTYWANDYSPKPLAEKILERPWLMHRIRSHIEDPAQSHLVTFNTTLTELELSVKLGVPLVGLDPRLAYWGTKSGNRKAFREAGVRYPAGAEDLDSVEDVVDALDDLWGADPELRRAVIKLNEGFSGEGNAVFHFSRIADYAPGTSERSRRLQAIEKALHDVTFQHPAETWPTFFRHLQVMGGIVEEWIEGDAKFSPSVQLRVDVRDHLHELSTHDQVLGGAAQQVFLGARFPADARYRASIQAEARKIGEVLRDHGIHGRMAVDFLVVERPGGEVESYAIEVNIRRGGTTHPFSGMHFLVKGRYDEATGRYLAPDGTERCYFASDNFEEGFLGGLLPEDIRAIIDREGCGFDHEKLIGNVFHMLGATSQFHKLGFTAIDTSLEAAEERFEATKRCFARASRGAPIEVVRNRPHKATDT